MLVGMQRLPLVRRNPRAAARAERRTLRPNLWLNAGRLAAPSPSGRHPTGQRLRPSEWSRSRSGSPRTSVLRCPPATTKISISAAASLISTRGANGSCGVPGDARGYRGRDGSVTSRRRNVAQSVCAARELATSWRAPLAVFATRPSACGAVTLGGLRYCGAVIGCCEAAFLIRGGQRKAIVRSFQSWPRPNATALLSPSDLE